MKSLTYVLSTSLLVRSPPPLPKVLLSLLPLPPENPRLGPKALVLAPTWPQILSTVCEGRSQPLFRTRLRMLHAEREWSQAKLAAQAGVTRQTINSIEKGHFTPTCGWHSNLHAPYVL